MKEVISQELSRDGVLVGRLHKGGLIHGDLTTSNMILKGDAGEAGAIYLIDFGLSFWDGTLEARGVDVHVYYQTLVSSHENHEALMEAFAEGYLASFPEAAEDVLRR
jgi:Kae1-associated kinase Bud32